MSLRALLAIGAIAFIPLANARFEGVCYESGATGFDAHKQRATSVFNSLGIPSVVRNYEQTSVYVEAYEALTDPITGKTTSEAGLYFHSNFLNPGFSHTTKVAYPTNDIAAALQNIFSPTPLDGTARARYLAALNKQVAFIFHENVFASDLAPIDLSNVERFFVTDGRGVTVEIRTRRRGEALHCHIENPCWDKEKWQVAEQCDTEKGNPIVAIINAILQGAFSGFQCVMQKR